MSKSQASKDRSGQRRGKTGPRLWEKQEPTGSWALREQGARSCRRAAALVLGDGAQTAEIRSEGSDGRGLNRD